LTLGHLISTVGSLLVAFAVIAGIALALVVSWLNAAVNDTARWSAVQAELDQVHESVTEQYLEANQSLRSDFGWFTTLEDMGDAIAGDLDHLLGELAAISDDARLVEPGAGLRDAAATLTATAVAGVGAVNSGESGARDRAIHKLELAFGGWRSRHGELATAMTAVETVALDRHSKNAGAAAVALAAVTAVAVVVFGGAWYLGRQAQLRERSLQRQLNDEKELLDTLVDQLPDLITWKDDDLRLIGCNESMGKLFRAAGLQLRIGERLSDHDLPAGLADRTASVEAIERQVIATGQPIVGQQVTVRDPDGTDSTLIRSAVPLVHKGRAVGVITTTRDVTQLIELERSLASATRLESIGQLAAGIAHEINTPVQFVSDNCSFLDDSFADLVAAITRISAVSSESDRIEIDAIRKETDLDFLLEEIPDAVAQSREGLEQIAKIVRAMKDFAHPGGDAGPTDINRLIRSVVDVSRNEWKYDADLELELADDLPEPHSDSGQIKQVVLNMIVNAAHAIADAERGKGTIRVATSSEGGSVFITVGDNGVGIPDEIKPRIFERFFTTKDVGRGSGQGLAIAYDAIKSHGGRIHCDTRVGVGTTFTIELPISGPERDETATEAERDDSNEAELAPVV
jgi:signal transduction histidine kinase